MSVKTVVSGKQRFLPLLLTVVLSLVFAGCAANYATPYNSNVACGMTQAGATTMKRTLSLAAISMQAQHWTVLSIDSKKGEVYGQYRDFYIVTKALADGNISVDRVDPSSKKIIENSTVPARWMKTLERAFNKFRCYSQEQIDDQLKRRNLYM